MKTYPYNRASTEGRRLFRLLDAQFNKGTLNATGNTNTFESYEVPAVTQCRVNKVGFLFASNLSGTKRPQVRVDSDVEMAWGDFADGVSALDFTHDNQELPLSYVQPLEDDTIKLLIDAGLYREERFEELMNKLMNGEVFDAEADMNMTYLDAAQEGSNERVPVLMADPVTVVHDGYDPSEQTTIANLVKRSAHLAMELQKEGVKTEEVVDSLEPEQDREVFLMDDFRDAVAQKEVEKAKIADDSFTASSALLDQEIDVTNELKGSLSLDYTNEDDRIRDLKERDRYESYAEIEEPEDDLPVDDEPEYNLADYAEEPASKKTKESSDTLDPNMFEKGLEDYEFETEDDGPDL